ETLGDAMLHLGFITRKELTWARRVQVVGVIRSIAAWSSGSFTIVADYLPKRDEGTLFPLPQILVELIVTDQDRTRFERALEGGNAVFEKTADFDAVFRRLGLNEDADAIAAEIDGRKNASEVAVSSGKDTFNVYKLLHALATLQILRQPGRAAEPVPVPELEFDFGAEAVADAADIWNEPPAPAAPTLELDLGGSREPAPAAPSWTPPSWEPPRDEPSPEPESGASAWDEPEEPATPPVTTALPKMPAWDAPRPATPPSEPTPAPAPIPMPVSAAVEEEWGFDEAQIETSKRATVVAPKTSAPAAKPAKAASKPASQAGAGARFTALIILFIVAILGAAGYYGYLWWQGRQKADTPSASTPAAATATVAEAAPPPATTDSGTTILEVTTTTQPPAVTPTTTAAATTTAPATAAPPAPATATAPPATTTTTTTPPASQPLPPVVPRSDPSRARLDAIAREFAAKPSGNFTVQIQILCEPSNVEKAMRDGGERVWFLPQSIGTRSCYRVFWGRYATREEAQQALRQVPAALRDPSAAVKPIPRP
ncbi:MAG TPA: SPOR domain-containing protein, partial [Thermoanaerobaculia bacterium]|nr:SPOR domain-containing protein [Thermoanaerobaculia bacterium]